MTALLRTAQFFRALLAALRVAPAAAVVRVSVLALRTRLDVPAPQTLVVAVVLVLLAALKQVVVLVDLALR
jgi:hypothetical protein